MRFETEDEYIHAYGIVDGPLFYRADAQDMENARRAVKRAVSFLDWTGSIDWRSRVAVPYLDLYDAQACVLGQVYGDYENGLRVLGIREHDAVVLGFNSPHNMAKMSLHSRSWLGAYNCDDLNDAWVEFFVSEGVWS